MSIDFYGDWLKVPLEKRPPNHFDLLGLSETETDAQVIAAAATLQAQRVKAQQNGPHAEQCVRLLKEIALAKAVLSNAEQRAKYVASLKAKPAGDQAWWKAELQKPVPPTEPAPSPKQRVAPTEPAPPAAAKPPAAGAKQIAAKPAPPAKVQAFAELHDEFHVAKSVARARKGKNSNGTLLIAGGAAVALAAGIVIAVVVFSKPTPATTPTNPAPAVANKNEKKKPESGTTPAHGDVHQAIQNADPVELLPNVNEKPAVGNKQIESRPFKRHTAIVQSVSIAPNGRRFLSASMDHDILDWRIDADEKGFRRHSLKLGAAAVAYMPNGLQAVCCDENQIFVIDLATNTTKHFLQYPRGTAQCLAAGRDGRHILIAGNDGTLHWWDVTQPKPEIDIEIGDNITINSVVLSPDGQQAVAACSDGKVGVWDIGAKKKLWLSNAHTGGATCVAFSPDGKRVASAGLDKTAAVWEAGDGKPVKRLPGHDQIALAVGFLSDGKRIISGGRDSTVRMWDIETGKSIRTFPASAAVHCLAVDREDRFAIAGGFGGSLQLIPLKDPLTDPSLREKPPENKYAVPGTEERDKAIIAVKDAYKGQWETTKPEEFAILLDRLLVRIVSKEVPATRYALFHEARDFTAKNGKLPVALKLVEDMDAWFEIDPLVEKTNVLHVAAKSGPPAVQKEVIGVAEKMLPVAEKEQRPELTKHLFEILTDAAERSASPDLKKYVVALRKRREHESVTRDRTAKFLAILKEKPDDPEANFGYALILFANGNSKEALTRLAKGSDKVLSGLAVKDLAQPRDLKPARELADGWWEASNTASDAKSLCLNRAKVWYEQIKPAVSVDERLAIGSRILEITEQLKPLAPPTAESIGSSVGGGTTPKTDLAKPSGVVVRSNFNTTRTEAIAKTQWKAEDEWRVDALGLRFPQGKGAMTSNFQLMENWKVVMLVIPERHVDIEVNQETIAIEQMYNNTVMEIIVERKGKRLAYTAVQGRRKVAENSFILKEDRLAPSTMTIRSSGFPATPETKRDGMLVSSIVVSGSVKMGEEKPKEMEKKP